MCRCYKFILPFAIFFAGIILFVLSCQRNKDCDVVINVVNGSSGSPLAGANIHMYIPPGSPPPTNGNLTIQDQSGVTDASGSVSFTFKLPAILQTDVTYMSGVPTTTLTASALVKLEEGKQVSKTIKLY